MTVGFMYIYSETRLIGWIRGDRQIIPRILSVTPSAFLQDPLLWVSWTVQEVQVIKRTLKPARGRLIVSSSRDFITLRSFAA